MENLFRRKLYVVVVVLFLVVLTSVVHAAAQDIDTFDDTVQTSSVDVTACTSVGGGTGPDVLGGERDILVARTSGSDTVVATVDTTVPNSLAFSIGAVTRGTALLQLDGVDGNCALSFGLNENLNPNDGISVFIQQVDVGGAIEIRVYDTASDYSEFVYALPYAISAPGVEIYFPFDEFTVVNGGADYGAVTAIEILLDGTQTDSLDMTLDYVSSDFSRDYGDLPAAYNNTVFSDNGARHRIGGFYLGSDVDSEPDGQESANATGDQVRSDDETGVTRTDGYWGDGTGRVFVDITRPSGPTGCLFGWIDWDGDNVFEATSSYGESELVIATPVGGDLNYNVTSPTLADYGTYPSTLNARFRIFARDEQLFSDFGLSLDFNGCPTLFSGNSAADITQLVFGAASDGEVEDYQWGFGPTAITLSNATASNSNTGLILILILPAAGLAVTTFFLRRRRAIEVPTKG